MPARKMKVSTVQLYMIRGRTALASRFRAVGNKVDFRISISFYRRKLHTFK